MADDDICLRPATEQAGLIRSGELSSRELLGLQLGRIERLGPEINAVVTLDAERAFEAAARADERTAARGARSGGTDGTGPLHGLPITVKDAIEVAGIRSTGGAEALRDHVPAVDAPAVARLRRAGAIVFGKTNVPEWSGDIQTFNRIFGATSNPWDTARTPGGSSGGPAAAVATGMTSFELGTDIGGSVRIPSSFCGVYGHKPSYGLVSQLGYLDSPAGSLPADINVFGPIARSAGDLSLLLDVVAGPDPADEAAWSVTLPPPRHGDVSSYRVGLWLDDPVCEVESGAVELMVAAGRALAGAGAEVSDARPPLDLAEVHQLFNSLLLPAISVSIDDADLARALAGNHRDWLDLGRRRAQVRQAWADWFRDYDVLLCPVMPMLPFPHDHEGTIADRWVIINGRSRPQAECLVWTGLVGVAYLPSTVVPVGRTAGLPVGMQVVGPYLEDRTTLFVAEVLADLLGGYEPAPLAR